MRVEMTIARVTWRLLMGRRRWMLALLINFLPVLVCWLFVTQSGQGAPPPTQFFTVLMATMLLTVLLPLSGLINGTSALGTELDDGTLRYVLAKPVPRWRIIIAKLATAAAATIVSCLPGVLIGGTIVLGTVNHVLLRGFSVAVIVASVLYAGLFMLLSLATRRALIIGLLYVIVWEGALSRLFAGTRVLSIREYSMAAAEATGLSTTGAGPFAAGLAGTTAFTLAAVMLIATVLGAIHRLRVIEVMEEV